MPSTRLPVSPHYAFEMLEDGVSFGRARREGTALCNAGIVDLGESTLVFDTSLTLRSARDLRAAALALTDRPPSLTVNSHWHLDHVLGNQVFADRPIYATRRTVEILLEKRAELEKELSREALEKEIRELERQRAGAESDVGRAIYDAVLRIDRAVLEEGPELKLTLPSREFGQELKLPGARDAKLLSFGAGHTESDAVLFLPKDRILFAGDLVVSGTHPNLTSGNPEHWLIVLDRLEQLRPERIVTGHGPLGSPDALGTMRDYLSAVLEIARGPGEPKMPERFRAFTEPDQFTANVSFLRARGTSRS